MRVFVLFIVVAILVGIVKLVPWWITVGLLVLLFLLRGRLMQAVLGGAARGLFDAKSRVLRGAAIQLHGVRQTEAPPDAADVPGVRHFTVDATITPDTRNAGAMEFWDPFELELADFAAKPRTIDEDDEPEAEGTTVLVHDVKQLAGETLAEIEDKVRGPARLQLHVAVPAGLTRAKFRYYFEEFGEVGFPNA